MKNYFKILIITFISNLFFFACSKNEDLTIDIKNVENSTSKSNLSSEVFRGTLCSYINDTNPTIITLTPTTLSNLCAPNAKAIISAGTSSSYKFIIDNALSNGQWSIYSGSGISFTTSNSLTASGTSVIVNFAPNFVGGKIQVIGNDSTGQVYGPILEFIKSTNGLGIDCSCLPKLKLGFDNNQNGSTNGASRAAFWFENSTCGSFDWSKVQKVTIQIGEINSSAGITSTTYNNWTNTPTIYRNRKILINNNTSSLVPAPGGVFTVGWTPETGLEAYAIIEFKNNTCPPQTIYGVLNDFAE